MEMPPILPDDEMTADSTNSPPDHRNEPGVSRNGNGTGDPLRLNSFRREIEAMQWRINTLRPHTGLDQLEVFEALLPRPSMVQQSS